MSLRKPCHMPFRKLIPPFTLTAKQSVFLRIHVRTSSQTRLNSGVISYFVEIFCEKNLGQIQSISLINRNSDVVSCFVEIFCEKRGTNTK